MKAICLILLSCALAGALRADEISDILDYRDQVENRLDDEFGIYITELSVNTKDTVYPAVGHYQEHITFYWGSEGGYIWPVLAVWTEEHSSWSVSGEVLYENPRLEIEFGQDQAVYQYLHVHNWDGSETDYSWFWSDGEPLGSMGRTVMADGEEIEFIPGSPGSYGYYKTPKELLELFRRIHGESPPLRE
jgi:hypothetical protein